MITDNQNFIKLLRGRIDLFPCGLVSGNDILTKDFKKELSDLITYHKNPLSETTGHLLFPKGRPDAKNHLTILNRGLRKLQADGTYEKLKQDLLAGKYNP